MLALSLMRVMLFVAFLGESDEVHDSLLYRQIQFVTLEFRKGM